jgi:drug/metabolite transporter (DMT)-like permease
MKNNISPYLMNFQQFLVVGLISLFLSKFYYNEMFTINISALKSIIFLAIFPTASAFIIQLKAQKFIDDFRVGVIFSLEPVFAAIFSWTLGGEIFTIKGFIGGSFIVTAMIISEMKIKNKIACEEG